MLPRFQVPEDAAVRIAPEPLRATTAAILAGCGLPPGDAAEAADVLVLADLRGVESHGVSNMLRNYVAALRAGTLNPQPVLRTERERPGTALLDGDRGLGIVHGRPAMELAIAKARAVGVGTVVLRNSRHLGAIGHFARIAAEQGLVGMSMSAAGSANGLPVLPTFGALPRLATNPLALAAPTRTLPVFLFDIATSAVANNKLQLARRLGASLAGGWVADDAGRPIMEPTPPPPPPARLLPLGSNREQGSHKGYALALMVEIFGAMLSGTPALLLDSSSGAKHTFIAWDIAAFCDPETFLTNIDTLLQTMLDTPPAPGHTRVIYPGIPEHEAEQERRNNGIPLHPEVVHWLNSEARALGLAGLG